ncbi:MAG: hypothetical protein ACLQLH_03615 [Terracidiphilus sp.]
MRGHYEDDRCGGSTWVPYRESEDEAYERVRQIEVDEEADRRRAAARAEVETWLIATIEACEREREHFTHGGDIADGEISAPYRLFGEAVRNLREVQA